MINDSYAEACNTYKYFTFCWLCQKVIPTDDEASHKVWHKLKEAP